MIGFRRVRLLFLAPRPAEIKAKAAAQHGLTQTSALGIEVRQISNEKKNDALHPLSASHIQHWPVILRYPEVDRLTSPGTVWPIAPH
jgi:hypothetical protein